MQMSLRAEEREAREAATGNAWSPSFEQRVAGTITLE